MEQTLLIFVIFISLAQILFVLFWLPKNLKDNREEIQNTLKGNSDSGLKQIESLSQILSLQLKHFSEQNEKLTSTLDTKMNQLHESNNKKLDQMRATVEEKLQGTLEKRLGESFKMVSERLEQVHKGLGEMQSLASGVGDLKKVLTNVKTRGTWGEFQLSQLLSEMLTARQYEANVKVNPQSRENVEFAIKLPGRNADQNTVNAENNYVWLPIDSKFPKESYDRLIDAQEKGDLAAIELSRKELKDALKKFAKEIKDKYICPPHTTDFGILFLPTESLFAEVLREPGLCDLLQRDYRVTVAGPTTLSALLNSLQMGFQTLAIQQRSSEVWSLLFEVKTQFQKFGEALLAVEKKLEEAKNKISDVKTRSNTINRKLRDVQEIGKEVPTLPLLLDDDGEEESSVDSEPASSHLSLATDRSENSTDKSDN